VDYIRIGEIIMSRTRKLTSSLLKRIIAEEKRKLRRQLKRRAGNSVQTDIKKSRAIKNEQIRLVKKLKALQEARRRLKQKIIRKM
jgi:hypothetical protein